MAGNLAPIIPALFTGPNGERLTADQIKRRQEIAKSLLSKATDTSPTAGGWTSVLAKGVQGFAAGRQNRSADQAGAENATESQANVAKLLSALTGGETGVAGGISQGGTVATPTVSGVQNVAPVVAEGEIADYIRQSATARGIDPDTALRVAMSEGGLKDPVRQSDYVKNGVREASYGPFQLYMGGGLGNKALEAGIDPRDPNQWRQGVDFALDQAATGGWSPWYGAAKVGLGNRAGLENARAIGFSRQPTQGGAASAIETVAPLAGTTPAAPAFDAGRFGDPIKLSEMPASQADLNANLETQANSYVAPTPAPALPPPQQVNPAPYVAPVQMPKAQTFSPEVISLIGNSIGNPYASPEEKQVASLLLNRQFEQQDQQQKLSLAQAQQEQERRYARDNWMFQQDYQQNQQNNDPLRQAQIAKAQRELAQPAGADESFYGNPVAITNQDGTISYGQIGNRGTFKPIQLGEGQTFAPPTRTIDAGTETIVMDQAGNVISRVAKNNRAAASDTALGTVEGRTTGERTAGASTAYQNAQNALDILDQVEKHPGLDWGTGLTSRANIIPGTAGYDFQNLVEQAKSGAFLSAIEQLRGLGALSNAEGGAATAAVNRMDTATSKEGFLAAVRDYRKIVNQALEKARGNMPSGTQPPQSTSTTGENWKDAGNGIRIRPKGGN